MAAITASMVGELRAKTDAPMMECKKALTEADGDMDKAEELLRVKLGNKAGKAASRITAEGVVAAYIDGTTGALVEVNCETDFVTKNDSFLALAKRRRRAGREEQPGRRRRAGARCRTAGRLRPDAGRRAQGPGRQDRREHVRSAASSASPAATSWLRYLHGTRIGVVVEYEGDERSPRTSRCTSPP